MATIHPATLLERREGYYVEIAAGAFEDLSGNPFAGISGPEGWNFTTVGPLVSDDAVTTKEDTPGQHRCPQQRLGHRPAGGPGHPGDRRRSGSRNGRRSTNGLVIYTPAANFSGSDTLRYTVRDVVGFESERGHGDDHRHRGAGLPESGSAAKTSTARGRSRPWTS